MLESILSLDTALLIRARSIVPAEYAFVLQILGESVVIWCAIYLIILWISGVMKGDNAPKIKALQVFFTVIGTFFFYTIINFGIPMWRPNPQEIVDGMGALIPHPIDNSFPSGHALFAGALLVGLIRFIPKSPIVMTALILGLITGISRVLGGVHYPGDVLGGYLIGMLGAYIISFGIDRAFFREYIFASIIRLMSFFRL